MANVVAKGEIQKCNICGNVVEVLHVGGGPLVCCGQPMEIMSEKGLESEGEEKHVPAIEKTANSIKVKIGSVPHPMEENHYIEWIEIRPEGEEKACRKYLKIGSLPEAEFFACGRLDFEKKTVVRAYCNIHGLWKAET